MEPMVENVLKPGNCTVVTVYNMEGEVVHKQFSNCDHLSHQEIANGKKFMNGVYFIIFQNRSLIRMERMIIN
jgi:hypothetical protein